MVQKSGDHNLGCDTETLQVMGWTINFTGAIFLPFTVCNVLREGFPQSNPSRSGEGIFRPSILFDREGSGFLGWGRPWFVVGPEEYMFIYTCMIVVGLLSVWSDVSRVAIRNIRNNVSSQRVKHCWWISLSQLLGHLATSLNKKLTYIIYPTPLTSEDSSHAIQTLPAFKIGWDQISHLPHVGPKIRWFCKSNFKSTNRIPNEIFYSENYWTKVSSMIRPTEGKNTLSTSKAISSNPARVFCWFWSDFSFQLHPKKKKENWDNPWNMIGRLHSFFGWSNGSNCFFPVARFGWVWAR